MLFRYLKQENEGFLYLSLFVLNELKGYGKPSFSVENANNYLCKRKKNLNRCIGREKVLQNKKKMLILHPVWNKYQKRKQKI